MPSLTLDFDVFDASQTHDMWRLMGEFRRRAPVARIQGGFVYVSRYVDARAALRDEDTFSNVGGMRPTGLEVPLCDSSIGELGPAVHAPARKLATTAAQGGGVLKRARPFVRETTEALLERVVARGSGDLIADYSLPLTARVIGWLLGMPPEDSDQLAVWAEEIMTSPLTVTNRTERGEGYAGAFPEFTRYLEALVEARLEGDVAPGDTITRILAAGPDGIELSVPNIRMVLLNLVLGGTATTRDLIGNLLLEILERPALHEQLAADRSLVPGAVEESLRLSPPVLHLIRTVIRAARRFHVETSICGEVAGEVTYTMLLIGMGLRTLSLVPSQIPHVKRVIRSVDIQTCERLARKVGSFDSERQVVNFLRDEVGKILPEMGGGRSAG